MAKVIIHATMTLDGFIARPNDEIDWAFKYDADEMVKGIMAEIGAVVMGNRGYISEDALPYGGQIQVPQFVVTHKPRDPATIGGLTFTFVDNIERAVALAKVAAGEKSVTLLGASIYQQCLNAGLVDEILIHLAPILIGEGIRLFDNLKSGDTELERIELAATGRITSLRFRVLASSSVDQAA
ncbi:MAG: dihydrofolate reductase family protein [Caldilineaceae bacterium]|nr:dihydrofolate reductase family protein [Caldilineaceae bacterium]